MFKRLTEIALAKLELMEARRSLLAAQSSLEYSEAMVLYHKKRVARLGAFSGESLNGQV